LCHTSSIRSKLPGRIGHLDDFDIGQKNNLASTQPYTRQAGESKQPAHERLPKTELPRPSGFAKQPKAGLVDGGKVPGLDGVSSKATVLTL
jgi:hypothetical protein